MSTLSNITQQRARLQSLAVDVLPRYGIKVDTIDFVTDSLNTVFMVKSQGAKYALRIHPLAVHMTVAIEAELCWLSALRADTHLVVPKPMVAQDGALVQAISNAQVPEPRQMVLFTWVDGDLLGQRLSGVTLAQAGAFMAQLHLHAEQFQLPDGLTRNHAKWIEVQVWQERFNANPRVLQHNEYELCVSIARHIAIRMQNVDATQDYGLTHSDLHQWNYLVYQEEVRAIDFDDCQFAPFSYDLAIPLSYLDHRNDYTYLREHFLQGYARVRQLPRYYEDEIDLFMAVRALDMIAWILTWPNIDHQPFGPELLANSLSRLRRFSKHL